MAAAPTVEEAVSILLPYVRARMAEGLPPGPALEIAIEDLAASVERGRYWLEEIANTTTRGRAAWVGIVRAVYDGAKLNNVQTNLKTGEAK